MKSVVPKKDHDKFLTTYSAGLKITRNTVTVYHPNLPGFRNTIDF